MANKNIINNSLIFEA